MATVLLILVVVLVLAALVFGVVSLLSGDDPGLGAVEPDGRAVPLPNNRSLTEADLKSVLFDVGLRGYRMAQVDRVLRRTAYDVGYKDEMIAVLEAEVMALRDGRAEDAELLRKARESAANPGPNGATAVAPSLDGSAAVPTLSVDDAIARSDQGLLNQGPLNQAPLNQAPLNLGPLNRGPLHLGADGTGAPAAGGTGVFEVVEVEVAVLVEGTADDAASVSDERATHDGAAPEDDRPEGSLAYKPVLRAQVAADRTSPDTVDGTEPAASDFEVLDGSDPDPDTDVDTPEGPRDEIAPSRPAPTKTPKKAARSGRGRPSRG